MNKTAPTSTALDRDRWFTPQRMVDRIAQRLGLTFTLDPAAEEGAAKAPTFFTHADDGLAQDWVEAAADGAVWLNPPYSDPGPWLDKAAATAAAGVPVVALLRASTDTTWWHASVPAAARVWALRGRVSFERPGGTLVGPANHASVVVLWLPGHSGPTLFDHWTTAELCAPAMSGTMAA